VGFNRRCAPLLIDAKKALERAAAAGHALSNQRWRDPRDSWIQRDEGGGRIVGEVCHFVDALTFLCGSLPIEAQAITARDHADAVSILIRFADGSTGTIVYTSLGDQGVSKEYLEAFATGRVVQLDDFRRLTITSGGKARVKKDAQNKGQRELVEEFLAATRGGARRQFQWRNRRGDRDDIGDRGIAAHERPRASW